MSAVVAPPAPAPEAGAVVVPPTEVAPVAPVVETPAADVATPPADAPAPEAPAAPVVPETYELTLPDGSPLDATASERTAATARALGLSNDAAQTVLDAVSAEVALQRDALLQSHQPGGAAWTHQVEGWKAAALADATLGTTEAERTAAIQRGHQVLERYGAQHPDQAAAMSGFLNDSGLGNHPAAVRFFAWIGRAMSEPALVTGNGAPGSTDADRLALLYPTMQPQ